jgi:hypothetical protein
LPGGLLAIEAVECGVKVMWDGRHMGVVAVPRPDHLGHLSGMCGDCDRNKDNEIHNNTNYCTTQISTDI